MTDWYDVTPLGSTRREFLRVPLTGTSATISSGGSVIGNTTRWWPPTPARRRYHFGDIVRHKQTGFEYIVLADVEGVLDCMDPDVGGWVGDSSYVELVSQR